MSYLKPEEIKLLEENRDLIESQDMGRIWNSSLPSDFIRKIQYSFYKLGIDLYKGLSMIPPYFYRFTFTEPCPEIKGITLPEGVIVHRYAFNGTLIERVAVPSSTHVDGVWDRVEEVYYENGAKSPTGLKVTIPYSKFDKNARFEVKLEPNVVYTVDVGNRIRVWGTDGINPPAFTAFPVSLREYPGRAFEVENLTWNGKNYRASGEIKEV